ncbi:MAG: N-6 DNA methylase [Planctomycetaceae bacterium]|nr:N-6 DNA methylase [Planctomycetaceae bacterium]
MLTRCDFITPFFKALGWDMDNENGYAESYREVIHKDKAKVGKLPQSPDYSFRLAGSNRLFFVETQKLNFAMKDENQSAYQVRRYGWNAKLPISIITDFKEFSVYDCTQKPKPNDKASVARIKYLTFKEYLLEFDFLWDTFSKEGVLKGSFDKFVQSGVCKKRTTTVDKEFLQSLDGWRTYLATSISRNNKHLDEEEIDFAAQQIINRIIFLRMAEDRNIEPYETLKKTIKQGDYYKNLFRLFEQADKKYNSGLFNFNKDKISKYIQVDNKAIKTIVNEFYYPQCPYEFSVLSIEILGSVYEQFLSKKITIDKTHRAKIKKKTDVRKVGGVYYTPQYVVDYIIKNTVGELIESKTPKEINKIKIIDPACGGGSFLVGAYQYLLDWHKNYYNKNSESSKYKKSNQLTPEGNLTVAEKKRILLNNIFGVDVDVNAVEVTKLSLFLKCMEDETEASVALQMRLSNEKVLPTLDENIKSGNSLIDLDSYDNKMNFGEKWKVEPFSWQKAFPEIFKKDGFDCVIGNPPYVKEYTSREIFEQIRRSHLAKYYQGKMDLWYFFVCYGIDILKPNGLLGFIVPNNWMTNAGASLLRNKILTDSVIKNIVDFGAYMVFDSANIQTMILILENRKQKSYSFDYRKLEAQKPNIQLTRQLLANENQQGLKYIKPIVKPIELTGKFLVFGDNETDKLLNKIQSKQNFILDKKKEIAQGIVPNPDVINARNITKLSNKRIESENIKIGNGVFIVAKDKFKELSATEKKYIKPVYEPYLIEKYSVKDYDKEIIYITKKNDKHDCPALVKHLSKYKEIMDERRENQQGKLSFYHLHWAREEYFFEQGAKILSVRKCSKPTFAYTENESYVMMSFNVVRSKRIDLKYLAGLLNSKMIEFWLRNKGKVQGNNFQVDKEPILGIPIFDTPDKTIKEQIIKHVEHLLQLNQDKRNATLSSQLEIIENRIGYNEQRINEIIYDLYGLTEEEIKMIENEK